uniref:Uncharacterized protein n=1 Tax=Molossus molossus TaxID=27622 RepID=A0A7J8J1B6_MOLMO|nr:hypothetical protein HJG59_010326 [Molossus molossus]
MVKQRNNSQMKEQESSTKDDIHEMQLSKLSEVEFRAMILRKLNSMCKDINIMSKDIETLKFNQLEIKNHQEEMKNDIAEIKNTLEGLTSRVEEAEDWISELEERVEKNQTIRKPKGKNRKTV